jgi:hypothetical protein
MRFLAFLPFTSKWWLLAPGILAIACLALGWCMAKFFSEQERRHDKLYEDEIQRKEKGGSNV